jgi:PASTA domain
MYTPAAFGRKTRVIVSLICLGILVLPHISFAQETTVTVPDLTGLNVPKAAATLNRSGLALGAQAGEPWTQESGLSPNTISSQSIPPGQAVQAGTAVDVTVLRSPNVLLIYDESSFTVINQTGAALDLTGVTFNSVDGNSPASFAATRWAGSLDAGGRCVQVWSIGRSGPQRPPDCSGVQRWLTTNKPAEHFWNGENGATQFNVVQGGIERATCDTAPPGSGQKGCGFYMPSNAAAGDVTGYIYFAYVPDRLIVMNQSDDRWMPLAQTTIHNYNPNVSVPGAGLVVGDPALFHNPQTVADVKQLAPGQCLLFTNGSPEANSPPQPCDVIAQLDISPTLIFWAAAFEVESISDGQRHKCPAATEGKLTVCVMPR